MTADTAAAPARTWFPFGGRAAVGVARSDVTPPVGIRARNWGAARTDVSTGVHRPMTATALSIEDAAGTRFLIAVDLGSLRSPADVELPRRVAAELGVEPERVLIHASHTHAGPSTAVDEGDMAGGDAIEAYVEALGDAIVDACSRARGSARDCDLTWAYGRCALAVTRDLPVGERDVVAFNPDRPADDTLAIGRISTSDGAPVAVLVNYACHPTTLAWQNTLISPDFAGALRQTVEEQTGALCLFLQGASGDLAPREQYVGDAAVADRHGRNLGFAALSTLETMPPPGAGMRLEGVVESGAALGVWAHVADPRASATSVARIDIPVIFKADRAQGAEPDWSDIDPGAAEERVRRRQRLRAGFGSGTSFDYPVWVWLLGDAVVVAHPGEAYSALQLELRKRHPDRAILVLNLTNGPGQVYLPTADAYERDRYQVWQTWFERGTLEIIIDRLDEVIAALPAGRPAGSGSRREVIGD